MTLEKILDALRSIEPKGDEEYAALYLLIDKIIDEIEKEEE